MLMNFSSRVTGIPTKGAEHVLTDAQDYEEKEISDQLP